MKYEILISEEVSYRYIVEAKTKEKAETYAMDSHEGELTASLVEKTTDRVEIINSIEVVE